MVLRRVFIALSIFLIFAQLTMMSSIGIEPSHSDSSDLKATEILDVCGRSIFRNPVVNNSTGKETTPFCSEEHRRAVQFCSANNTNQVLARGRKSSWPEFRPYSLSAIASSLGPETALPACSSLQDYLDAIKLGVRVWGNADDAHDEMKPSRFIPHGCYVPSIPRSPKDNCDILAQYNHVIVHGDSLGRHLRAAIYMALRGNYVEGGLFSNDDRVRKKCKCDGQFSENDVCRLTEPYFNELSPPRDAAGEQAACSEAENNFSLGKITMRPFLTKRGEVDPGESVDWDQIDCSLSVYRGILLVLNGGLHWESNSYDTFKSMIEPTIQHPKYRECLRLGKVRTIWTTMQAQSRILDEEFPHQSRENTSAFNSEMLDFWKSTELLVGEDILILDWWNMSKDAQTSDGVHQLSDINIGKASQILYLAENWPFPYV